MEKFVDKQFTLQKRISRTVENMKKLGAAKITKGVISARLDLLEKNWATFQQSHDELLDVCDTTEMILPYFTDDHLSKTEEYYLREKAALLDYQDKEPLPKKSPRSSSEKRRTLPAIKLPSFSGDYKSWPNFRDLFTSIIRDDSSIPNVERLHYLKTSLTGEAARLLQNITVTDDHFERAWQKIVRRYENKRRLTTAQLSELTTLPAMTTKSATELTRLVNATVDAIQALETLGNPANHWGNWLVFITAQRLDIETRMEWETHLGKGTELPTFEQLQTFLEARIDTLEAVEEDGRNPVPASTPSSGRTKTIDQTKTDQSKNATRSTAGVVRAHVTTRTTEASAKCPLCDQSHFILFCSTYKSKTPQERKQVIINNKLCYNCLGNHAVKFCKSTKRCQSCLGKHHTTLHTGESVASEAVPSSPTTESQVPKNTLCCQIKVTPSPSMLLATAVVKLSSTTRTEMCVRALIDPCSEMTLIREGIVQLLKLPKQSAHIPVAGVGEMQQVTRGVVNCRLSSLSNPPFSCVISAFVLSKLTTYRTPKITAPPEWTHLTGLDLADPHFAGGSRIDLLLGADVYAQLILEGLRRGPINAPVAQRTKLGWILTGPVVTPKTQSTTDSPSALHCASADVLGECVQRFWLQEEAPGPRSLLTAEEVACEKHFSSTCKRDDTGRYVVRLPFATPPSKLGSSRMAAQRSLEGMERRRKRDDRLSEAYVTFMQEYALLGHMKLADERTEQYGPSLSYYLPHHGVWKELSTTTKLRVVFNGSHKTTTGYSLNDLLHKGPNLLTDINSLLIRWRLHYVVFSADIEKMYRQIQIHPDDADYQRILWRESPSQPIREYKLVTVTYGLACAPFLAIRTLHQLAEDEKGSFPLGASALRRDVYVDDVISGADSIDEAKELQGELIALLRAGGFNLRKWCSNYSDLVTHLPKELLATQLGMACTFADIFSLLGLRWDSNSDCFLFAYTVSKESGPFTKRKVFSEIARLFDPLGFLAPLIVTAKIFMQSLWLLHLSWDEPLPPQQQQVWENYREELPAVAQLKIPRWVSFRSNQNTYQLHGFCDASEKAYAAVVYLRAIVDNTPKVHLLLAKSRVAPLKQISLPRLELNGATLLARLIKYLLELTPLANMVTHLWSDSTVVLSWLQSQPSKWKTFVANRVSEIQVSVPKAHWHHIRSQDNPADCASRGLLGRQLVNHHLWRSGPEFLSKGDTWVTIKNRIFGTNLDAKGPTTAHVISSNAEEESWNLLNRYSNLRQLLRVTAWILRFVRRFKHRVESSGWQPLSYLTAEELATARLTLLKLEQRAAFRTEIGNLSSGSPLKKGTPLLHLTPFLDANGLLRVGSRLKHSLLSSDQKYPIILPKEGHFVQLLVKDTHEKTLHGGTQLTLNTLRQRYWILCGRKVVRSFIHRCLTCFRWRAQPSHQLMGNLPALRVTPSRPFLHTGVDYAGPFAVKTTPGRGHKTRKGYVAVFVCLATRAVHLEVASDYTTEAFLAALRRFISRRGNCASLRSDCGTNFVGADKELRSLFSAANKEMKQIIQSVANDGITWKFNPPGAPHFGGIWEAAVKAFKFHLRRVIGDTPLTFEELTTVLTQIEACLNSRPLIPLTDEPDDLEALTPGHFLIGSPLTSFPEPSLSSEVPNRLSRWQLLSAMRDHFWQRWASEYLHTLHARPKWVTATANVNVGDLCLIWSELYPPTRWPLARVKDVHPGDDGKTRVVTLRTATSTLQRPITKICVLPSLESDRDAVNSVAAAHD